MVLLIGPQVVVNPKGLHQTMALHCTEQGVDDFALPMPFSLSAHSRAEGLWDGLTCHVSCMSFRICELATEELRVGRGSSPFKYIFSTISASGPQMSKKGCFPVLMKYKMSPNE
mmetsp:Transcript_92920/g.240002  ORF Transcript_92920/g.240002 Transcript_92920/m.240002 type:complete len:114 (+) Transcript_92920:122-463(+)